MPHPSGDRRQRAYCTNPLGLTNAGKCCCSLYIHCVHTHQKLLRTPHAQEG